ncbi:hypothetical protein [Photobacterium sp. R1]
MTTNDHILRFKDYWQQIFAFVLEIGFLLLWDVIYQLAQLDKFDKEAKQLRREDRSDSLQ